MVEALVQFFSEIIPAELTVFVISLLPVLELRGGLVAAKLLGVDLIPAMIIGFIGTILPTPFILLFIRKIFDWMRNTRLVFIAEGFIEDKEGNILATATGTYIKMPVEKIAGAPLTDENYFLVPDDVREIDIHNA